MPFDDQIHITIPGSAADPRYDDAPEGVVIHRVPFMHPDDVTVVNSDPLYTAKVDFMRKNNIVVFRMHDHMHAQRPDFTYVGSARDVGLDQAEGHRPAEHHGRDRLGHRPALEPLVAVHRGEAVLADEAAAAVDAHREAEVGAAVVERQYARQAVEVSFASIACRAAATRSSATTPSSTSRRR